MADAGGRPQPETAADNLTWFHWPVEGAEAHIAVTGDFTNWDESGLPLRGNGPLRSLGLRLDPGVYLYEFRVDGRPALDPFRPLTGFRPDGREVSRVRVGEPPPELRSDPQTDPAPRSPRLHRAEGAVLYQIVTDRFRLADGRPVPDGPLHRRLGGHLDGITAAILDGTFATLGITALWISPVYRNPEGPRPGMADAREYEGYHGYWPVESRVVDDRMGGEAALRRLIDTAHSHDLRVLLDLVPNHVDHEHPVFRQRGQTSEHTAALIAGRAPDLTANWFGDPACVCGVTCSWVTDLDHCWFTPHLPDINWRNEEAASWQVADALWWLREFQADGFRIDAVPMMPHAATWRLRDGINALASPHFRPYLIGECYTGPGGRALIDSYRGDHGLDALFDFPLMWALREAFARQSIDLRQLWAEIATSYEAFRSGAPMGVMVGNHDVPRFLTEAVKADDVRGLAAGGTHATTAQENLNGEFGPPRGLSPTGGGFTEGDGPAPDNPHHGPYARLRLALGMVLTLPGLPVVYYGDEWGLSGGGDPDNRRPLPAPDAALPAMQATFDFTKALIHLRRHHPSLFAGDLSLLRAATDLLVFARRAARPDNQVEVAIVAVNRSAQATVVEVPDPFRPTSPFSATFGPPPQRRDGLLRMALSPREVNVVVGLEAP